MSAQPIPITAPDADPLNAAVADYIAAKRAEDAAKKARIAAEDRILALAPAKEEGSTTREVGDLKLTLTGKLSYACDDMDALREITRHWDSHLIPIKTSASLDDAGCRFLRRERPDLWAELARCITVKPAKTSVTVKV